MGVPSFYRWLVNKYPKIVSNVATGGENPPEFDNLYLDMNGIIHPCFHPDDNPFPPTSFDEVFRNMHDYIDHLVDIIRPRKLLFMAIDGVAPRAKMNQQRARRFRAAKDAELAEVTEERLRKQFENEGKVVLPKVESEVSDSNIITPGTEFMHTLSENLRGYVNQRMNENPAWANIKVILSDDKAPGEGEHKIMTFIRAQRVSQGYDPNTSHCLYGLDADLIMLALATHEVHFSILREEVLPSNRGSGTYMANIRATAHSVKSRGWFKDPCQPSSGPSVPDTAKLVSSQEAQLCDGKRQAYQILNISILREYLALDMEIPSFDKFECDLERIIDDFIFICFFAGNDFLPHIPSLEIHEGCIDLLMDVYKKEFQNLGGYLVNMQKVDDKKGGYIKLKRVERFILAVGAFEEKIFIKRTLLREKKMNRILAEYRDAQKDEKDCIDEGTSSETMGMYDIARLDGLKISATAVDCDVVVENTKELMQKVNDKRRNQSDLFKDGCFGTDRVKFGTPGWKERYYKEKFSVESPAEMESMRKSVVEKYSEGLCWVLLYYFSELPSWKWFYPYYYPPFASDFRGVSQMKVIFHKGLPFEPLDQLMGVLPPRSAHALPLAYKKLMVDENSKIIDLYPTEFGTDVDGKRFLWQGICKLPFIEEERLLMETRKLESQLQDQEKSRNIQTCHQLLMRRTDNSIQQIVSCLERIVSEKVKGAIVFSSEIVGIKGTLHVMCDDLIEAGEDKNMLCMYYEIPRGLQHIPRLLEGVNIPEKTVMHYEIEGTTLWHESYGSSSSRSNYSRKPDLVSRPQNQPPAVILKGAGQGFCRGRGKTPVAALPLENPNRFLSDNPIGSFKPTYRENNSSYRDYGSRGHQPSGSGIRYAPREGSFMGAGYGGFQQSGSNHHATSNYRPVNHHTTSNYRPVNHHTPSIYRPVNHHTTSNYRPVNHHTTSNYRPVNHHSTSNYRPVNRGACEDWRVNNAPGDGSQRNYAEVCGSGHRQLHANQSFVPNGGRGQGQGQGRGWSASAS